MSASLPSFILGYHGCDASLAEDVFAGRKSLRSSQNDYDWLGNEIYFWEQNANRAFNFAKVLAEKPRPKSQKIKEPAVVGAIIDLGFCLNLFDDRFIALVKEAHINLVDFMKQVGTALPQNRGGKDLLARHLDCAVIKALHQQRAERDEVPFDTLRAAFIEGTPLYAGAGFAAKNHIQVCVRNPQCIIGYFRPLGDDGKPQKF